MSMVGSSGWYAALGVLSTPPAGSGTRIGAFRCCARRRDVDVRGECRRFPGREEVAERAPVEAFTAAPNQLDEAGGGRLGIGQRVMRPAVNHSQLAAQALEPDRVLEIEELGGKPGG